MSKNKKILVSSLSVLSIFSPALASFANDFKYIVENILIRNILKPIPALLISLMVVIFIYGVIVMIFSEGGKRRDEGKQYMLWGIIGLFVVVSMWGLVNLLITTFGLQNNTPVNIPVTVPTIRIQ